ncbi:heat-shock protein Hsp20 [Vallitalea longa]|uniref:Heat-shock protein Hsp20 n=1 Tax=Vallitalea longa TaxID=2936439 RepID=A0A9W5YC16_9FIRM|nr:Hsp20/alpha crystallin family protein [Vallitalea longa]GKX29756.1 heat-shock protein Hsp20 [Vallitalea longa]
MFGLTPFNTNPIRKSNSLNNDFYDMIDDFFDNSFFPRNLYNDTFKVDVKDADKEYTVEAEMPGINKEDIKLDYNEGRLTISVSNEENVNEEQEHYIHRERKRTSMQRGIFLKDIVPEKITANLKDGVLRVVVPKKEKSQNTFNIEVN